jgi:hypothetical protein
LVTEGHRPHIRREVDEVDASSISGGGGRRAEVIVVEQRQEMLGSGDGGTFEGRSSTLEQTDGLFIEGRGDNPVDPEQLGVELLRQLGLKEDRGLSAQGRHFAEAYEETRMRRGDWRR